MSSRASMERVEEIIGLRAFDRASGESWYPILMSVASFSVIVGDSMVFFAAGSVREMVFPAIQISCWMFFLGFFVGQGLYSGVFGRIFYGMKNFGRRLRFVFYITLVASLPVYFASWGGHLAAASGRDLVHGTILGAMLGLLFWVFGGVRNIKRLRNTHSRGEIRE